MPRKPKAEFQITAENKSKRVFKDIKQDLRKMGDIAIRTTKVLGTVATAVAALSVKMAADFDKGITEVGALLNNVTQREMAAMKKQVQAIGIEFGQSRNASTKALFDITSAGFKGAQGMKVLAVSAKLAVAGVTDISNTADLITAALGAYGKSADDAERISDIFFATQAAGKTTIEELAASIGDVLPTAALLGVELEEVGAAMATLTLITGNTAKSTTQLNAFFLALLKPTEDMKKLGITALDATGKMLPLLDVIKQFEGIDPKVLAKLVPSVEAFRALAVLSGNFKLLEENLESVRMEADQTQTAFELMADATSERIGRVSESFKVWLETMGDVITESDEFKIVTTEFQKLFIDFAKSIEDNREELTEWVDFIVKGFRFGVRTGINTLDVFRAEWHLLNAAIFKTIQLVLLAARGWAFLTDALEITEGALEVLLKAIEELGDLALGAFESAVDILNDMKVITGEAAEETKKQAKIQKDLNTELKETKKLVEDLGKVAQLGQVGEPGISDATLKRREKELEKRLQPLKKFKEQQADLFATIPDAFGKVDLTKTFDAAGFEKLVEQYERLGLAAELSFFATENFKRSASSGLKLDPQLRDITEAEQKALNKIKEDEVHINQLLIQPLDEVARLENILDDRLRAGTITALEHKDAVKALREEYGVLVDATDPMIEALDRIASGLEQNLSSALVDAIRGENNLMDSTKRMVDFMLTEMVRLAVVQPFLRSLFGESGSGGGLLGTILSGVGSLFTGGASTALTASAQLAAISIIPAGIPGFEHGGSFMVGGPGGTDRTPVRFMASRGERVTVETPDQQRGGNGTVVNEIHIHLSGAKGDQEVKRIAVESIRRAAPQLIGASVRAVLDGRSRDPQFFG